MATTANVLKSAEKAVNLAGQALAEAQAALAEAKTSKGSGKTSKAANESKGSAGRVPSPEQVKTRQTIVKALVKGLEYFTISELAEALETDRIQTRNAVNYLEQQGAVIRYGEKLPEGRGQRELIYKAADLDTIKAAAA